LDCTNCNCIRFKIKDKLDEHLLLCEKNRNTQIRLPEEGKNIKKFVNHNHEFKHPFYIVADFESTLLKVNNRDDYVEIIDKDNKQIEAKTVAYQKHIPNSYGLKYNCIHEKHSEKVEIFNNSDPENVCEEFILRLETLAKKSYKLTQQNYSTVFFENDEENIHKKCNKCDKCKCEFTEDNYKVKHHDHINGRFIGSYCNKCNFQYKYKKFIPVYLHNLKGYDMHLFVKSLYKYGDEEIKENGITCIPNNEQSYISVSKFIKVDDYFDSENKKKPVWFEIRFIDTFAFMTASIDSLISSMKTSDKQKRLVFKYSSEEFINDEEFNLMIQKGVYPYDYIDNYDKFSDNNLPKKKLFYSKLSNESCSKDKYEHAQNIWKTFKCNTLLDYHNLYLKTDVLLLCDIWENFRNLCNDNYKLDCCYYYTVPGLAWDAMLKKLKLSWSY